MEAQAESVKNTSSAIMGGSFVFNLLLAGSLSLLWGLINSLQLVTHFPLTNVIFPSNAKTYFGIMFEIGNFDMIPTDQIEGLIDYEVGEADKSDSKFNAEDVLSDSTIEAGYDSANIVNSNLLNLILLSLVVLVVVIIIILRIFCFKVQWVKNCLIKIWRMIFWNLIIRTVLETYLEVSLVNMIKMYAINDESWFETAGSTYSISILAGMTLFCLLTPVFLIKKQAQFKNGNFISKYGALTQDMKTREKSVLFYHTFFMTRRLCFSVLIVYLAKRPWAQIQVLSFLCTIQLIYVGYVKPFILTWMSRLETTNEFLVLTSTYFLFVYSDGFLLMAQKELPDELIKDWGAQEELGWVHVGLLGVLVVLNMAVMLTAQISDVARKIKLFFLKRTHRKRMVELDKRKKLQYAIHYSSQNDCTFKL